MEIDPVVVLADELRETEGALRSAVKQYERDGRRENGEAVNAILAALKSLHREFFETVPTSALGASELVRMVAHRLPFAHANSARRFHDIADRLGAGRRDHADLVWLRAMRVALAGGLCGEAGQKVAPLLGLAILGAARPVVVFRSVTPLEGDTLDSGFRAHQLQ
ncbi:MAG TPA: hypothetical protein VHC40_05715 [Rhizomicrobium sp.]|nr:hypothetical protein [Rhizomicrobium sp.]